MSVNPGNKKLDPDTKALYSKTLAILAESKVPFLLGGAYALSQYMDFERHTRDLDVFVKREDCQAALDVLQKAGYRTELTFPHWLGKAYKGDNYIDIIFSSGNAIAEVDDECFQYAREAVVMDVQLKVLPPEEIIWSKAFIMERERFDGADIAHLLRAIGHKLDWNRLLRRFGENWRVLFSHLVLFGYIYPSHRSQIPNEVMTELMSRLQAECTTTQRAESSNMVCQGTILSREQYLVDTNQFGYADARLEPLGNMSAADIEHWTAAIATR